MRTGISSYAYSRLLAKGSMDIFQVIDKTKEIGFDAIEFSNLPEVKGFTKLQLAEKIKGYCLKKELIIANYATGADMLKGSKGNLPAEVERVKGEVDVAKALGVDKMRHDASFGFLAGDPGAACFEKTLIRIAEGCRAITEYAAGLGIRTMVENHGRFCQDSDRVELLVNEVDHENFGVLLDVGNFMCVDEDPAEATGRLIPYAFHVHFKDFHVKDGNAFHPGAGWILTRNGNFLRGAIIGHGDLPLAQCMNIIRQYDYKGILSIEFEGLEDPLTGIEMGYRNLKRLIAAAWQA
ncbi:MAG: sugar phosphate isomerase/epimerase family protein [Clostridia bacterium]